MPIHSVKGDVHKLRYCFGPYRFRFEDSLICYVLSPYLAFTNVAIKIILRRKTVTSDHFYNHINEYILHLRYQIFIPALKKYAFYPKNSRKLLKSLTIFTFFSLSFNSKNRLISPTL